MLALLARCLVSPLIHFRVFHSISEATSDAALGLLIAIGNTAAVVGFGSVTQASPAFDMAVSFITSLPVDPLVGAAVVTTIRTICNETHRDAYGPVGLL